MVPDSLESLVAVNVSLLPFFSILRLAELLSCFTYFDKTLFLSSKVIDLPTFRLMVWLLKVGLMLCFFT